MSRQGEEIRSLRQQVAELSAVNQDLQRRSIHGDLAAIANHIDESVTRWVEGHDYTAPFADFETAFNSGVIMAVKSRAEQLLVQSDSETVMQRVISIIPHERIVELATHGLREVIMQTPTLIGQLLGEERVHALVDTLASDQDSKTLMLEQLTRPAAAPSVEEIQSQVDAKGTFRTDTLPMDARISFKIIDDEDDEVCKVNARVVQASDGTSWMRFISQAAVDWYDEIDIKPLTLFRLGYVNEERVATPEVVIGGPVGLIFHDGSFTDDWDGADGPTVKSFKINDQKLVF